MEYDLNKIEEEILTAAVITNSFSPTAHNSRNTIFKIFGNKYNHPKDLKKIRKGFKRLITIGLLTKHPTGEMTYNVSRDAINMVTALLESMV